MNSTNSNAATVDVLNPSARQYTVTNLKPESVYVFRITAQTRKGWGEAAEALVVTTEKRGTSPRDLLMNVLDFCLWKMIILIKLEWLIYFDSDVIWSSLTNEIHGNCFANEEAQMCIATCWELHKAILELSEVNFQSTLHKADVFSKGESVHWGGGGLLNVLRCSCKNASLHLHPSRRAVDCLFYNFHLSSAFHSITRIPLSLCRWEQHFPN